MNTDTLTLIRPTPDLAKSFHQMILEFRENGENNIGSQKIIEANGNSVEMETECSQNLST